MRRRGSVALISLSTAVPTLPLMATGTLGRERARGARTACSTSLRPRTSFASFSYIIRCASKSLMKRLTDSAKLLALLKQHGVELILHGHDHVHSTMRFAGPNGEIPAIGVPSVLRRSRTGIIRRAAYNLFSIEKDNNGWRCEQAVHGLGKGLTFRKIKSARLV